MTKPPHPPEFFLPFQDWSDQGPPACFFGLVVHRREIKKNLPDGADDWQEYQIDYVGGGIYTLTYNPSEESCTEELVYRGKIPSREFFEAILDNMETPLPEGWKTPPVLDSENMKALADRIDEHIAQSESQREADVLRDEMAAHADYRERAQAGQTTEDDEEIYGHGDDSESDCEAAESADEKPDGQAENARDLAPPP